MNVHGNQIKLFAGSACPKLAKEIADCLGLQLGQIEVGKFSDGECSVHVSETVRGSDVYVIQSTSYPVNDNLMELLVMIDALKRASARPPSPPSYPISAMRARTVRPPPRSHHGASGG